VFPIAPALVGQALSGDVGALGLLLLILGFVGGLIWALKIRDPSVNRKKYG
jgi:uncharacterized membrane protein YqaE (UPF0057 family)